MARAPMVMPSMTRSGYSLRMSRSLKVPGSPSSALHMMYLGSRFSAAAKFHLMPVGKPAPPRPLSLESRTMSMMSTRGMASAFLRPSPAGMVEKVSLLPWVLMVSMLMPHTPRRLAEQRRFGRRLGRVGFRPVLVVLRRWSAPGRGQLGVDLLVHQHGRALVAHAHAVGPLEAEGAVGRRLAEVDAQIARAVAWPPLPCRPARTSRCGTAGR